MSLNCEQFCEENISEIIWESKITKNSASIIVIYRIYLVKAMTVITLVWKIDAATIQGLITACSLLTNDVNFTIDCGLTHLCSDFYFWHTQRYSAQDFSQRDVCLLV